MSYTDKCCGVCDEYQDLRETNKIWVDVDGCINPEYVRFYNNDINVCGECINKRVLAGINVSSLLLHKDMEESRNITKGTTLCVDPTTNAYWVAKHCWMDSMTLRELGVEPKYSKPYPRLIHIIGIGIKHEGLSTIGGIYSKDKRKLRRTLRKLGVVGKIEVLVK